MSWREGEAEPDWSPRSGRREISEGYPRPPATKGSPRSHAERGAPLADERTWAGSLVTFADAFVLVACTDWLLMINAMMGSFLSGLSARIFLISLPTVGAGLETDIIGISWALIAYQVASISLSVVFGRLGDIYGRYRIYGLGFVLMTIFSPCRHLRDL